MTTRLKIWLRGQTPGQPQTKDWVAEAFDDRLEIRFGPTGRPMQTRRVPARKCRDGDPVLEAHARAGEKVAEGYWQIDVTGDEASSEPVAQNVPADASSENCLHLAIVDGRAIEANAVVEMATVLHRHGLVGLPDTSWDDQGEVFAVYLPRVEGEGGKVFRLPIGARSHGRGGYSALFGDPEIVVFFAAIARRYPGACDLTADHRAFSADSLLDAPDVARLVHLVVDADDRLLDAAIELGLVAPPLRKQAVEPVNSGWFY